MEILVRGTPLDTDDVLAPGARPGSPIVIERGLGECPHGFWYQARQDEVPLLVTVLDPILVAQPDLRAQLARDIERGRHASHRNLLPCYGLGTAGVRAFVAEAWPGGGTVREFTRGRREHGHALDREGAYTLVAHVCNGLVALHEQLVHGYVTADTVHVTEEGRVLLGAVGIGGLLPRTRGFSRFRFGGLLPNIAPEQVLSPPRLTMATDVFGVAALFIELVTGQSLVEAGQPLRDLGLRASDELMACLERATSPDPDERQPDVGELKAELAEALRAEGVQTSTRPPGELDAGLRAAMEAALASSPRGPGDADDEDWSDFEAQSAASGLGRLEIGVPPAPGYHGADGPVPAPPGYGQPADPGALAGQPYPPPAGDPGMVPPGYPYPPPGYPYPPPGYPYPPGAHPPPGYPPPGYPYPPPGYPYPPPGYPYPPPGYPYPPPGYPYPSPSAPGAAGPGPRLTPPPRPAAGGFDPEAARRQMDELDRATRRIAGIDADSAVAEYTEHVGDGESRFDLDDDAEPAAEGDDSGSASLLGLEVDAYEDAAQRLATLDGVEDTETARKAAGPSQSGTFFGSFSDEPARPVEEPDDPDARWSVVRDGKAYGPYSISALGQMIRSGRVRSVDTLRREGSDQEAMAVDVPALRSACDDRRRQEDAQPARARPAEERLPAREVAPASPASPAPRPAEGRPAWLVTVVVAVVVAAIGIAGYLMTR